MLAKKGPDAARVGPIGLSYECPARGGFQYGEKLNRYGIVKAGGNVGVGR